MTVATFLIHLPPARAHLIPALKKRDFEVVFFTTTGDPIEAVYREIAPGVPHVMNPVALSGRNALLGPAAAADPADVAALAANETTALHCLDRSNAVGR